MRRRTRFWLGLLAYFLSFVVVFSVSFIERAGVIDQLIQLHQGAVEQTAREISVALKVGDKATIHRAIVRSFSVQFAEYVRVYDLEGALIYGHVPKDGKFGQSSRNEDSCSGHPVSADVGYAGQQIGTLLYCLKVDVPPSGLYVASVFGLAIAFGAVLLVMLRLVFNVLARDVDGFCRFVDSLDPSSGQPISPPVEVVESQAEIAPLYIKVSLIFNQMLAFARRDRELQRQAAIAQTTQMLAHDVRKPFSLLQTGLGLLRTAKSSSEMIEIISLVEASVGKAVTRVNGMLDDIMEIGRTGNPTKEPVVLEALIDLALVELFQVYEKAKVGILYELHHSAPLHVDEKKIHRVLSNILENGVQAMKRQGTLFIATRELSENGKPFMEITLGNDGPVIPEEAQEHLFEAFFTSDKPGGTGLGLAIAKKVVIAHGGRIWCQSPGERLPVEFHFTLPVVSEPVAVKESLPSLPRSSEDVYDRLKSKVDFSMKNVDGAVISDPREAEFEALVLEVSRASRVPLTIVLIDDESVNQQAIEQLLGKDGELGRATRVVSVKSATEALANPVVGWADLVICDVDLGDNSMDGYRVVESLRLRGFCGRICVHSNRCLPEDFKRAIEAGADIVFPKPMSRVHLLQIISEAAGDRACRHEREIRKKAELASTRFPFSFAVVEDESMSRSLWRQEFGESVHLFASAEELVEQPDDGARVSEILARFDFIVTDYYLGRDCLIATGADLARLVKRHSSIPVFLCSNVDWNESEFRGVFSGQIPKVGQYRSHLEELLVRTGYHVAKGGS